MSDSQFVVPTRGKGKAATTKKTAAPKKATGSVKKVPARGRGKKVVDSEESEEETSNDDDEDIFMDDLVDDDGDGDDADMDVDEGEEVIIPAKATTYAVSPIYKRSIVWQIYTAVAEEQRRRKHHHHFLLPRY